MLEVYICVTSCTVLSFSSFSDLTFFRFAFGTLYTLVQKSDFILCYIIYTTFPSVYILHDIGLAALALSTTTCQGVSFINWSEFTHYNTDSTNTVVKAYYDTWRLGDVNSSNKWISEVPSSVNLAWMFWYDNYAVQ